MLRYNFYSLIILPPVSNLALSKKFDRIPVGYSYEQMDRNSKMGWNDSYCLLWFLEFIWYCFTQATKRTEEILLTEFNGNLHDFF